MNTLFLAWQDFKSRTWFPVGKLTRVDGLYHFSYLQGAIEAQNQAGFQPIWSFPNFYQPYSSTELFPLFANRLLRPDYEDFVRWLNLPQHQHDPISLLARSGGKRKTDSFEVFPNLERDSQGNYHVHFFAQGLRNCSEAKQQIQYLQSQTPLLITQNIENQVDSQEPRRARSLSLQTEDRNFVGCCPHYLSQNFFELICCFPQQVSVTVERVNLPPTPLQFRLLCHLVATWTEGFQPFSSLLYQSLSQGEIKTLGAKTNAVEIV
ncbi:DNA-binding protein [Phormidesmis sp. 146-35]